MLCKELGEDAASLRASIPGRSESTKAEGKPFMFSSARKMMSWAVPTATGYRIYCKGASEINLAPSPYLRRTS